MSYSRWSNSTWYSFWSSYGGASRADQVLSLWADFKQCKDWTYDQIKDWTIQDVCEAYDGVTYEEAEEGWGYIQLWLEDVEQYDDEYYRKEYDEMISDLGVDPR